MPLPSGLELYAYNLALAHSTKPYALDLEELTFTTIAPGGFGDLTAKMRSSDVLNIPPELRIFSNIALMDLNASVLTATGAVFLGRWDEPGLAMDQNDADIFNLHAMGASHSLQDDPSDTAYSAQTAGAIISSEITTATHYILIDQDTSNFLPFTNTGSFSPAFAGKTLEDKLNELTDDLGDYAWFVWDHPKHKDTAGFPTWSLYWNQRSTQIAYQATVLDMADNDFRPAAEYSYNVVQIKYRDSTTDAASSVTVADTRLTGTGAQGTAPFPRRKIVKDYTAYHLSASAATAIANALLGQYQSGGWKIVVEVDQVRDAVSGALIPLHGVRAGYGIFLPELTVASQTLQTTYTENVNYFFITETEYRESQGQTPRLTITCNSYWDTTAFQIARMQYVHKQTVSNKKINHVVRTAGEPEKGTGGIYWGGAATTSDTFGQGVNFKTTMTSAPSSVSLSVTSSSNYTSLAAANIQNTGFTATAKPLANGAGNVQFTYTANP